MSWERLAAGWETLSIRWMLTLGHFLWQGLACAAVVALLASCVRRPTHRYGIYTAGLLAMTLCPIVTWNLLSLPSRLVTAHDPTPLGTSAPLFDPASPLPASMGTQVAESSPPAAAQPSGRTAVSSPEPVAAAWNWHTWAPPAVGIYAAGVIFLLLRLTLGLQGGRKLCRQAEAVADRQLLTVLERQVRRLGLRTTPVLAYCHQVLVPTVVGVLRPTILLPWSMATGFVLPELEAILAHELAHIKRLDPLINLWQRTVESFLFFHPAVWWLSRRIQIERELCCDDLVVELGTQPLTYANSLLHVAEAGYSRSPAPAVVGLHAVRRPSELRQRVARILGLEAHPRIRLAHAWPLLALAGLFVVTLLPTLPPPADAGPLAQKAPPAAEWGDASQGLQARVKFVSPETDEQHPDFDQAQAQLDYARPEDLTLLVELKNVSDKPISLQGVRYGDSVTPPWPGKSVTREFAPYLFDYQFLDKAGMPLALPEHKLLEGDTMLTLSGGSAEKIGPGKSLVALVRPAQNDPSLAALLKRSSYQLRVTYHGPAEGVKAQIRKHWPDKPLASVWSGRVVAGDAGFTISPAEELAAPKLNFGPVVGGLQAAMELQNAAKVPQARKDNEQATFPQGARLNVRLHVKNSGKTPVAFWSEMWRQDDQVTLIDAAGKETNLAHPWYSGWPRMEHWTLKPGETAILSAIQLGIAADEEAAKKFEHPIGSVMTVAPGKYQLRSQLNFHKLGRKGPGGEPVVPDDRAFEGTLVTGPADFTVRLRIPADEPPTFTGRLQFQTEIGKPIATGHVRVRTQSGGRVLAEGDLLPGSLFSIPDCPEDPIGVDLRSPGFEEIHYYDVVCRPNEVTTLQAKRAEPVTFRLLSQGKPVAGAEVRYFNRSKQDAGTGPYPPHGLEGPIWATSQPDGRVVLDTLQKFDPLDNKLGNNIYWFYITAADLAPRFIGPIQAGMDLGDITLGSPLTVSGRIEGTPAELDAFAAEWDQPEPMKRGDGQVGWHYAQSVTLETKREGGHLTFQLSGLRPGPFRIVSRFKRGGKPISHVYTRRDPNEDDVVFEVELTESRNDLVVRNMQN